MQIKRLTISFFILAGLLFLGIAIMIKPTAFVHTSVQDESSSSEKLGTGRVIPREIIILGSALTIGGLVGLTIQGFRVFNAIEHSGSN